MVTFDFIALPYMGTCPSYVRFDTIQSIRGLPPFNDHPMGTMVTLVGGQQIQTELTVDEILSAINEALGR